MKKCTRCFTTLLAAVLLLAAALPSALAAKTYEAIHGGTFEFNKELSVEGGAHVPNVTFDFTVEPGEPAEATSNRIAILAGPAGATIGSAVFAPTDSVTDGKVTKAVAVDFTQVSFTEPGIYRYVITENETTALGVSNDANTTRYLDVYVYDRNGTLEIPEGGYVLHTGVNDTINNEGKQSNKSAGFTNIYETANLTFSKTVTGNQGSKDKYFKFTVTISGVVSGTVYDVDITNAIAEVSSNGATKSDYVGQTNPDQITVPADATSVTTVFYLQDGQSITIKGLANGSIYSVTEDAEDYTSTVPGNASGTIASTDVTAAFTNDRSGVIPTGVLLTVAPFAAITAVGAVGILVMVGKKRKQAE